MSGIETTDKKIEEKSVINENDYAEELYWDLLGQGVKNTRDNKLESDGKFKSDKGDNL
ncbi:hypothetical protein K9M48_03930 [Candidatus Gracilibacteria bacterium]|nr:hypothetical protein [Candidatus Gracilibacteria bacterium]